MVQPVAFSVVLHFNDSFPLKKLFLLDLLCLRHFLIAMPKDPVVGASSWGSGEGRDNSAGIISWNDLAEDGPAYSCVTRDCTEVLWNKEWCRVLKSC